MDSTTETDPTMMVCRKHGGLVVHYYARRGCPKCGLERDGLALGPPIEWTEEMERTGTPRSAILSGLDEIARVTGKGAGSPHELEYELRKEKLKDEPWPIAWLKLGCWIFGGGK